MPGVVAHALFPLLPILAFTRVPRRAVWLAWPFVFLPDLDYLVPPHRALLHNLFLPAALVVVGLLAHRVARLARHRDVLLLGGLFWATHLVMDVFAGGVVPFWPLLETTWLVDLTVDVATDTNTPLVYLDFGAEPGIPVTSRVYAFLTRTDAAILASLLLLGAARLAARRLRAPGPTAPRRPGQG